MEDLILALPTRDFIAVRGYTQHLDMAVLEALQHDTWLAIPAAIREDPLAAGVEIGLVLERGGEVLLGSDGRLLERGPVVPEELSAGALLVVLRRAAEARASRRLGQSARAELIGWYHDPQVAARTLVLVYRTRAQVGSVAAAGTWVTRPAATPLLQDRVEQAVLAGMSPAAVP